MNPADLPPERWEELATLADIEAITDDPTPEADQQRRQQIRDEITAAWPGQRPPMRAYMPYAAEYRAMKERHWAGASARKKAALFRDYAILSGIARATTAAEEASS